MKSLACRAHAFFAVTGSIVLMASSTPASATALGDLAAGMQPGEWRELTSSGFSGGAILYPNVSDNDATIIEYTDEAHRNPHTKKIYIMGCARGGAPGTSYVCGSTDASSAGWIEYDEISNSWRRMPAAPVNTAPHSYDRAAMNPANGDYFYIEAYRKVWKYSAGVWTNLPTPNNVRTLYCALEYFPERNELICVDGGENGPQSIHALKLGDSAWTTRPLTLAIGQYANFTEYSAKHKVLFFGGGVDNEYTLRVMDASGVVKAAAAPPVRLGMFGSSGRQTIDPISGDLVVFDWGSKSVYAYSPVNDRWTTHGVHPLANRYGNVMTVSTPVPEYGVIFVVKYDYNASKVYLYKHSAGAGTPLPADTVPPAAPAGLNVR